MNKQGVKSVFKLLALILLITFLVDKIIYLALTGISNKVFTGQTVGKLNQYELVKDTMDVIVYGSSRANHHIIPDKISKRGFNMGVDGQFIAYYSALIHLLPKRKEQLVVLHLDPDNLFNPHYRGEDVKSLGIKYHQNKFIREEIKKRGQSSFLNDFFWSLDYNQGVLGILKNYFKPKYDYKSYNGYDPLILNETQIAIRNKTMNNPKIDKCTDTWEENVLFLDYLKGINEFCRQNNKELIAISSPIYRDFCHMDNKKLAAVMSDMGITYLDYTNFFEGNTLLEYWKDNIHLSSKGADLFSDQFADDINKLHASQH